LSEGVSVLSGIEGCDDTEAALRVVQALGARVERTAPGAYSITGGLNPVSDTLDIGESGLSTRLFTPISALCSTPVTITGHGSILSRPMEMMLEPLRTLGVDVRDHRGHLPVTVRGPMRGGEVEIDGSVSSQFLTGLLMALPLAADDTTVRVRGLKSIPYIDMTIAMMDRFGIDVDHRDYEEFYIPGGQRYTPARLTIEGDWSAASCLLVAGATAGGEAGVTIRNLNPVSLQADVAIIEALSRAGARIEQSADTVRVSRPSAESGLRPFSFDATDCPDLFPALAALAASCPGVSTIIGTSRLSHKESDRARAIFTEYGKLGVEVDISEPDIMRITGGGNGHSDILSPFKGGIVVDSHGDHRMAMSLAVAGLNADGPITITGAQSVSKSYADFWTDYEQLRK
jgi:3-phosphoshikimate 1-carboxyvinyltransferase